MNIRVQTAVVPAAGLGTRMRPATRAVPKELLPVGGRPAIEWVIDEAVRAGLQRVVVVSSPAKAAIDAYVNEHLGARRPGAKGIATLASAGGCAVEVVHQDQPRGLGDAVRVARAAVGPDEPVVVLLPDELLLGHPRLLEHMVAEHERSGRSVVSLLRIAPEEAGAYGCARIAVPFDAAAPMPVVGCVEKPSPAEAVSPFALSGRYVLGPDVLDALDTVAPDGRGEIQLTAALDRAGHRHRLVGLELPSDSGRVDVGNWRGWLEANVSLLADAVGPAQVAAPLAATGSPAASAGRLRSTA